jgi:LuxR family maltose regulon positive regulatory protein
LLEKKTEGWAAGLQLALNTLDQKPQETADEVIRHFRGSNRYVFDYLAEEVFQQQPPEVQSFLLRTSILGQMSAEVCNAVLEIANAQILLEYLERRNLFIVSLEQERRWYRYHQLFRDFLLNRFHADSEKQALRLQATVGDYYAERGIWDLAIEHYTMAHDTDGLARAIRALAPAYIQSGRMETLHRYILALPPSYADQEPDFLLYQGHALHYRGEIERAIACYERACDLYRKRGEQAKVCHTLTQLARVARSRGLYRQAQKLAQDATAQAGDEDHAERAQALMSLAKTTGFLEGMAQGYQLGSAALREAQLAGATLAPSDRARLLCSQAQLSWWYGDPFASVAHCQAALDAEGETISPLTCRVYVVMATPHLYWGDLSTARRLAEQGVAISEEIEFTEWLPMAYTTLGNVLSRQEELGAGERLLRRAIALSRELGVESYAQLMASGYLALNLVLQGYPAEARRACEEALHLYAGSPETYELCVCRSVLGDVLLDMGDLDTAWEYFLNLRHICETRQFRLPLAMVYFALGYLHLEAGRREPALELIRRSLNLVYHANVIQLYVDQGQRARVVCRAAQEAGIHPDFVEQVLAALGPVQAPPKHFTGLGTWPILQKEPAEETIKITCFGGLQIFYQGQDLGREIGLVGKPRELLAYFVTHRNQRLPLDRILEDVWPGSDPVRGQAVFHTTLYRLRRALTRVAGPGDYVRPESGEYQLEQERFQIDVDLLESYLAQAQASTAEPAIKACEAAIAFYTGPYLATFYYEWCEQKRRRLDADYLTALRLLVAHYTTSGDYHQATAACERILEVDPLLEQTHCDLMRLWHRLGNQAAVVKQYQTLTRLLMEELDTDPMPETRTLYTELVGNKPQVVPVRVDSPGYD